jgi:hypothetical protein
MITKTHEEYRSLTFKMLEMHCMQEKVNIKEFRDFLDDCFLDKEKIQGIVLGCSSFKYESRMNFLFKKGGTLEEHKSEVSEVYLNLATNYLNATK